MTGFKSGVSYVIKIARRGPDGIERYREEIVPAATAYLAMVVFANSQDTEKLKPGERVVSICEAGYH